MYGYSPRSIKKASDTKLIIARFMLANGEDRQIKLINVYKGVPISHDAMLIKVINDRLTLKFHHNQALLLNLEGQTYILSALFPKPIKATVMTINTTEQVAILTDFSFSDPSFRKREAIRVDIDYDDAPNVTIASPECNVRLFGKLSDISVHGIGVIVIAMQEIISKNFSEGAEVQVQFKLPFQEEEGHQELTMWGEIRHIERSQENYRLGIKTYPNAQAEGVINHYVSLRQAEILDEIEKYSSSLSTGNWVFPAQI